jgi:hypothetical protein
MNVIRKSLLAFFIATIAACSKAPEPAQKPAEPPAPQAQAPAPVEPAPVAEPAAAVSPIEAAVDGAWRSADDRSRDPYRHPAEALAFWGLQPGMSIREIQPGAGWHRTRAQPAAASASPRPISATRTCRRTRARHVPISKPASPPSRMSTAP